MRDAMNILIRPVVSEKTYASMETGTYVFVVDPRATKIDVRNAVEQAFNVKVTNVNTLNRKGKQTRNRRTGVRGSKPNTKRINNTFSASAGNWLTWLATKDTLHSPNPPRVQRSMHSTPFGKKARSPRLSSGSSSKISWRKGSAYAVCPWSPVSHTTWR